jgi:hypothetical protein
MKVTDKGRLAAIETRLVQALLPPEERAAPAAAGKPKAARAEPAGAAE